MTVIATKPDNSQLKAEIRVMKKAAKRLVSDPEKARKFLIEGKFMTPKTGKLTKRYGG